MRSVVRAGLEIGAIVCGLASPDVIGRVASALEFGAASIGLLSPREQSLAGLVSRAEASLLPSVTSEFAFLGEADRESIVELLRARIADLDASTLLIAAFEGESAFFDAISRQTTPATSASMSDDEFGFYRALIGIVHASVEQLAISGEQFGPVVRDAFRSLRAQQMTAADVRKILAAELEQRRPDMAARVVMGTRPRLTKNLIDRAEIVRLREAFAEGAPNTVQVLSGMRGSGKSQAAAAIAAECEAAGWPFVVWVTASSREAVRAQLRMVAVSLRLATAADDEAVAVAAMTLWLNDDIEQRRLLIFDDVERLSDIEEWLPRGAGPRVIVTTTMSHLDVGEAVPVGMFSIESAIDFLVTSTGLDDIDGAEAVARELGRLPLALAQAAATIKHTGLNFGAYLGALTQRSLDDVLLPADSAYSRSVWAALGMSVDTALASLQSHPERAAAAHRVLAVLSLSPERGMPRPWLTHPDHDEFDSALATGALIAFSILGEQSNSTEVTLHRLLRRVLRERLDTENSLDGAIRVTILMIARLLMVDAEHPEGADRRAVNRLALYMADVVREPELEVLLRTPEFLKAACVTSNAALRVREPAAIIALEPYLAPVEREFGVDNGLYLSLAENVTSAQSTLGYFDEAIRLRERLLHRVIERFGPTSGPAARQRIVLANTFFDKGDEASAQKLLADARTVTHELGGQEPLHHQALAGLAMLKATDMDASERITVLEEALSYAISQDDSSADVTVVHRNNLAQLYVQVGSPERAIVLFEENLRIRRSLVGDAHPTTLNSTSNLMHALVEADRAADAVALGDAAYARAMTSIDDDHPDVLTLQHNRARARTSIGDAFGAAKILRDLVPTRVRVLGRTHPLTLVSRYNLLNAYSLIENDARARSEAGPLLADAEETLGANDALTVNIRALKDSIAGRAGQ